MKVRNLLLLAGGVALGYKLAQRMREDDPYVVSGPQREKSGSAPLRIVTGQAQRIVDQAGVLSLDAIRRTRVAIQSRLGDGEADDAAWN
ncbi:MAG: hypothetical protein ABI572_10765 [Actinomycetota bacterium]